MRQTVAVECTDKMYQRYIMYLPLQGHMSYLLVRILCNYKNTQTVQTSVNATSIFSIVFARWQHYIQQRFALSGNSKEFFNPILDPYADADHHQNLITSKLIQV